MERDLTLAVLFFLDRLDSCMVEDYGFTETLPVVVIRDALLGKAPQGEGCNIDNLAEASAALRRDVAFAVNDHFRHGDKSISMECR